MGWIHQIWRFYSTPAYVIKIKEIFLIKVFQPVYLILVNFNKHVNSLKPKMKKKDDGAFFYFSMTMN